MQTVLPIGLSIAHAWAGHHLAQKATQMSPMQTEALQGQSTLAKEQSGLARVLNQRFSLSAPAYGKALDYYSNLVGGGRAALDANLMPETSRINDIYRGSATNISNTLRGPQRDKAMGDLARQHASQLAGLRSGARSDAAGRLLQEGSPSSGGVVAGAYGAAGDAYSSLSRVLQQRQKDVGDTYSQMGGDWAKMWIPYFTDKYGGKNG